MLRNTDFNKDGSLNYKNAAQLNVEIDQFEKRKLINGDLIIERSGGGPDQPVGRACYFDKDEDDYTHSNFTTSMRVIDRERIFSKYLFYFLHYQYLRGVTKKYIQQTTGIQNLDFDNYLRQVSTRITSSTLSLKNLRKLASCN